MAARKYNAPRFLAYLSDAVKILERGSESLGNGAFLGAVRKRGEDKIYITVTGVICLETKVFAIEITLHVAQLRYDFSS